MPATETTLAPVRRLVIPRVVPLELWNLPLPSGSSLVRRLRKNDPLTAFEEALRLLHAGDTSVSSARVCEGFTSLVVLGGAVPSWLHNELGLFVPCRVCENSSFFAAEGGLELGVLFGISREETLVVDVGQSALKLAFGAERKRVARVPEELPTHYQFMKSGGDAARVRENVAVFISEAMRSMVQGAPVKMVLFALAGAVNEEGIPGANTYVGMGNDPTLLPEILQRAGIFPHQVWVMNDAELAASSVLLRLGIEEKTLVLTFGFGLGAALIEAVAR